MYFTTMKEGFLRCVVYSMFIVYSVVMVSIFVCAVGLLC